MKRLLIFFVILGALLVGFLLGGPRSVVDWRPVRALVLESDDWGLAGFIPSSGAWDGLDRDALGTGRFPDVYWGSTLEDAAMVDGLVGVLTGVRGADGLPALFQPNYVMSSLHLSDRDDWVAFDLPDFPPDYARPRLWEAVERAMDRGVWHPEFHATYHYDPEQRLETALASPMAREVTARGIMIFPGSEKARELAPSRTLETRAADFDHALDVWRSVFGWGPESTMAPDYTWDSDIERMWEERGITIVQGKREQRHPGLAKGKVGRVLKYVGRRWDKVMRPGRTYLERNCRFEPVQVPDAGEVVASCLGEVRRAWAGGHPAIVEAHRVNFAHTDPEVVRVGQEALGDLLEGLDGDPARRPRFMADREVGSLSTRGTSWALRGDEIVVRNATRGRKLVLIPQDALHGWSPAATQPREHGGAWMIPVSAREVQKLDKTGAVIWRGQIR